VKQFAKTDYISHSRRFHRNVTAPNLIINGKPFDGHIASSIYKLIRNKKISRPVNAYCESDYGGLLSITDNFVPVLLLFSAKSARVWQYSKHENIRAIN